MLWNALAPSQTLISARQWENWYFLLDQGATRQKTFHRFNLHPVHVPVPCWMQLCPLLTGTVLGAFAATTTLLLLFWHQNSPALCWLANCQRAMAAKGFTLQPQRISGHIQTAKGQPGAVPYKNIFWCWTLPSALKPSPGILFLFDSLKKTPMGGRENNTSQQSHVKTMRLFLSIHNKCKPGSHKFLIKVYYMPSNSFTKSARNMY